MVASPLRMIFCLSLMIQANEAQDCIPAGNGEGLPSFQDYRDGGAQSNRIARHHQAIIPSYKLECNQMCGNITLWGVDIHPGGGMDQIRNTLDLQVWRPSPTVDDSTGSGCYSLVGNNRFTSISVGDGVAVVTPSPQEHIQFRPGDVLGFYIEEAREANAGVVILTNYDGTTTFTSETVWYVSIAPSMATSRNGDCPYSVGSSGVLNALTRAAPVISIDTITYSCPPLPSMATAQPTPPPNPITGKDKTPPTTNQQPQEPVDLQTRTTSTNGNTEGKISTNTADSEGTETAMRLPTTSETIANPILSPRDTISAAVVAGIVIVVIVVIILTLTVVIIIAVLLKKCGKSMKGFTIENVTVPKTANKGYGTTAHDDHERVEENIYNYPEVDSLGNSIEAKQNEAYTCTNINIITEGNQAYTMNITTEENVAYKPVTVNETADEYDYI